MTLLSLTQSALRSRRSVLPAVALLACAACATVDEDEGWFAAAAALQPPPRSAAPGELAPAAGDDGIGRTHDADELAPGDILEYSLVLHGGDRPRAWLLRIRAVAQDPKLPPLQWRRTLPWQDHTFHFTSPLRRVAVEVLPADRRARAAASADVTSSAGADGTARAHLVPTDFLQGIHEVCARVVGARDTHAASTAGPHAAVAGTDTASADAASADSASADSSSADSSSAEAVEDARTGLAALLALLTMRDVAHQDPAVAQIVWAVLRLPLLALLRPTIELQLDPLRAVPWPTHVPGCSDTIAGYRVPVLISVGGSVALECSLGVVPSRGPLRLGAGIVSVLGLRPGDHDARVELALVSVHRAPR